ncbi:CRYL1 [Mytilus coruscus]|uniref:L-gulonate 3-dehydrogenase n=1 Tax=Mytilus coruscus TaxID=42192 RepID=A0A6J8CAU5_MYTCO|nr:CRYL1 [Mytilus coruscus]
MIFAGAGYSVCLFDVDPAQLERAKSNISSTLQRYEKDGLMRGTGTAIEQFTRVSTSTSLEECLNSTFYVQECVPENLELKTKWQVPAAVWWHPHLQRSVTIETICLWHTLYLIPQIINPPYFIPLVEMVPAPWTKPEVMATTRTLMEEIGQSPVSLKRECPGFALNRLQYACINEAWNMYQSGLLSAEDIDKVCYDGLGPRYAFIGPLETMHLNADGIVDYCKRYAEGAVDVQKKTFKPIPTLYDVPTAEKIQAEYNNTMPLDKIQNKRLWRDNRLAALAKLKKEIGKND